MLYFVDEGFLYFVDEGFLYFCILWTWWYSQNTIQVYNI